MKNNQKDVPSHRNELDASLRLLWRRRGLVLIPTTLFTLLAIIFWISSPRLYSATALLMLEGRQAQDTHAPLLQDLPKTSLFIRGEIEVLRSSVLLTSLITEENLALDPEFSAPKNPIYGWLWPQSLLGRTVSSQQQAARLQAVRQAVAISQLNRALVIGVSVKTQSPKKSARLANRLVQIYLAHQRQTKIAMLDTMSSKLKDKLNHLKEAVYTAEANVVTFRNTHGLGQDQDPSLTTQTQRDLLHQITKTKAEKTFAEETLKRLKLAEKAGRLHEMPDVVLSPTTQSLMEKKADIKRYLAELEIRYGPKHPRIRHAKAQITETTHLLRTESSKIVHRFEHEAAMAHHQEKALKQELHRLTQQRNAEGRAAVHLRELERRAETQRAIYQNFLRQFQKTTHQVGLEQPDIRILSQAFTPNRPSGIPRPALVAAGFFLGLLLGIVAASVVERLDHTIRNPDDIRPRLGLPVAGVIPLEVPQTPLIRGNSVENLRFLTQHFLSSHQNHKASIIVVTSALPEEGKTTLSHHMGQLLAHSGKRVLLIDADLRRPGLSPLASHALDSPSTWPGTLTSVLKGHQQPENAIISLKQPHLFLLPGIPVGAQAPDLLDGPHMAPLLDYARDLFDIIIVDTPPVLPVVDTCIIAKMCHKILFTIRWNRTPDVSIQHALERLDVHSRQTPVSAALTMVDLRKQPSHSYGGYSYTYDRMYDAS